MEIKKKKIHFLEKLSIPSAEEEAPMEIYQSYEDKHLNIYEPIKTVDIINETFMPTYSNSIPMIPSDFGLNSLISTQPHWYKTTIHMASQERFLY